MHVIEHKSFADIALFWMRYVRAILQRATYTGE
jgi:hypothetical protein